MPKDVNKNLKYEIEYIIKSNESLADNKKTRLKNCCPNIGMETISWTLITAKQMSHINLVLTGHKDQT